MSYKKLIISASRMKFKNPLGAPESILLRGLHKKFEPIRPRGFGCRGGAIDFGPTTSYNSGTSVVISLARAKFNLRISVQMSVHSLKSQTKYGKPAFEHESKFEDSLQIFTGVRAGAGPGSGPGHGPRPLNFW